MTAMTSTPARTSGFRPLACVLLGLILAGYGVYHGFDSYPGPDAFSRFADALPVLGAVASFALGVAAAVAGAGLAAAASVRLRRRRHAQGVARPDARGPFSEQPVQATRQAPVRREEEYEPEDCDEYHGTASGYPGGGYGGAYGPHGGHPGGRGRDNGEYERRRAASYPGYGR